MGKDYRPSKLDYYMNITKEVASRSNCKMVRIGSIIVRDDQIIATGYVGAPRKTRDCQEQGICLRREQNIPSGQRYELCRSVHAEQNAIINAARAGVSVLNGVMYIYAEKIYDVEDPELIDSFPCFICKKMILNSGLEKVICKRKDGSIISFNVSSWAEEWNEKDMTSDLYIYNTNYSSKKE